MHMSGKLCLCKYTVKFDKYFIITQKLLCVFTGFCT